MDELYNYEYSQQYSSAEGIVDYKNAVDIQQFLTSVASSMVEDLHLTIVLDAGRAMEYLVEALRDRGVETYGIDISEYAISQMCGKTIWLEHGESKMLSAAQEVCDAYAEE